jgi:hypothetical protein
MDDPSVDDEELELLEAQSKKLQRTAEDNTPEGIFPYVLYLLSRPPIFPETDDDAPEIGRKRAEGVYRSLRMVSVFLCIAVVFLSNNLTTFCLGNWCPGELLAEQQWRQYCPTSETSRCHCPFLPGPSGGPKFTHDKW